MLRRVVRSMSLAANRSTEGPLALNIRTKVQQKFPNMTHFAMYNDSYKHSGHHGIADAANKIESHFRLEIVTDDFKGLTLPKRHRLVYSLLDEEFQNGVHALQLTTRTTSEQSKRQ